jgi:superfamily II DNA or RNA helicase
MSKHLKRMSNKLKMDNFSAKEPDYRWQDKAIQKWIVSGKKGMIEAVTGSGKSHVGMEALAKLYSENKTLSTLIIVPTIPLELVDRGLMWLVLDCFYLKI